MASTSKADTHSDGKEDVQRCKLAPICQMLKLKKPTPENLLFWYTPRIGAASYTAFSVHIFNPHLLESLFPNLRYTLANCLLFNAHLGCGLYLFNTKHLSSTTRYYRIMYSVYGSLLFNFGSILLWAVTKSILPEDSIVRTVFSFSSSICLLLIGKEYITYIDGLGGN